MSEALVDSARDIAIARLEKRRAYHREYQRKYNSTRRGEVNRQAREWRAKNREHYRSIKRKSDAKNKHVKKEWRKNNQERISTTQHAYYVAHKKHLRSIQAKADKVHRELKTNRYWSKRLRTSLYLALCGKKKSASAITLLGCPLELFKLHLQNQFRDGMAWNNYGTLWHIDHIRPCASFDLSRPEDQAACFHYSNMQPLLAIENMRKGSRYVTG